jgi:hypothetical protein
VMRKTIRFAAAVLASLLLCCPGLSAADRNETQPVAHDEVSDRLLRLLYRTPPDQPVTLSAPDRGTKPYRVELLRQDVWTDVSRKEQYALLVAAAIPEEDVGHVSPIILGIGLFRDQAGVWVLQAGSPRVDVVGSYGVAPPIELMTAGAFGRAVIVTPGYTAQGITEQDWLLYVPVGDAFKQVMSLKSFTDHSGFCNPSDKTCLKDDFSSAITLQPYRDGVIVTQVGSGNDGTLTTRRWLISPSGLVTEE